MLHSHSNQLKNNMGVYSKMQEKRLQQDVRKSSTIKDYVQSLIEESVYKYKKS